MAVSAQVVRKLRVLEAVGEQAGKTDLGRPRVIHSGGHGYDYTRRDGLCQVKSSATRQNTSGNRMLYRTLAVIAVFIQPVSTGPNND
jgi:hypothetical protein